MKRDVCEMHWYLSWIIEFLFDPVTEQSCINHGTKWAVHNPNLDFNARISKIQVGDSSTQLWPMNNKDKDQKAASINDDDNMSYQYKFPI